MAGSILAHQSPFLQYLSVSQSNMLDTCVSFALLETFIIHPFDQYSAKQKGAYMGFNIPVTPALAKLPCPIHALLQDTPFNTAALSSLHIRRKEESKPKQL